MPEVWASREPDKQGLQSLGKPTVYVHGLRYHIHDRAQKSRIQRRGEAAGHQNLLFGSKRPRSGHPFWDGQRECSALDKKNEVNVEKCSDCLELDELFWFTQRKPRTETRENVYLMTMVSRSPRQIVGFDVAYDKSPRRIQAIVDGAPAAAMYCTDGWSGYIDVIYPGGHVRNTRDKSDTYTVEGVNADLRHYIPLLKRRSRCFARTLETLQAVVEVFVDAYNRFGLAKYNHRIHRPTGTLPFALVDFL